ncbi:MAG: hypothetical protein ACK5R5_04325 [Alphaproteobacteria bacterium]|jgi:hypothetical protein
MRYLTDFPDLPIMAFRKRPDGRLATLEGGKGGSAPPPPDYRGAAEQTAAGNLETAKFATKANRINQFTPYGSLRYRYTPQYDAEGKETGAGWEQTLDLTPEAQSALDEQLALNKKYGQVANIGFERARSIFENPELDVGALPKRAIDVGQTAQEALLARLNPQLQSQEEATRQRLANTGIGLGSDAFSREMAIQGQQANDLRLQAALQGINLDQANRAAALQEQAYLQDRPLNLINALRSGNQVQAPQFQQFALQNATQGPDYLNAANAQYGAQLNAYNAEQASSPLSGLFGLGMGIAKLPVAGGGSLGGNFIKGLF